MTKEDIIAIAREAGFSEGMAELMGLEGFANFAALIAAAERDKWMERTAILIRGEREACAQICENFLDIDKGPKGIVQDNHAKLIRARS